MPYNYLIIALRFKNTGTSLDLKAEQDKFLDRRQAKGRKKSGLAWYFRMKTSGTGFLTLLLLFVR